MFVKEIFPKGEYFFWSTIKGEICVFTSLMMSWLDDASMCWMIECMWVCVFLCTDVITDVLTSCYENLFSMKYFMWDFISPLVDVFIW